MAIPVLVHFILIYIMDAPESIKEPLMIITFFPYLPCVMLSRMVYLDWTVQDLVDYITPFNGSGKTKELYLGKRERKVTAMD